MVSFLPYHYQIFSWVARSLNPTYHFLTLLDAKTQKTLCSFVSLRETKLKWVEFYPAASGNGFFGVASCRMISSNQGARRWHNTAK